MKILFLDDELSRRDLFSHLVNRRAHDVFICADAMAAMSCLQEMQPFDFVFLDHDLGEEACYSVNAQNSGSEVARFLAKHKPRIKRIIIHSLNCPASEYMKSLLTDVGYVVEYIPWGWMKADRIINETKIAQK